MGSVSVCQHSLSVGLLLFHDQLHGLEPLQLSSECDQGVRTRRKDVSNRQYSLGGAGLPGMHYSLKPSYCSSVSLTPQRFCLHCGQMALSPLLPLPFPECALPPEGLCLFLLPIVLPWPSELHSFNKKPLSHGSESWTSQVKVSEVLVSCEALFPECK